MTKILITGSTGQVGSRLTKNLLLAGYEVIGLGTSRGPDFTETFHTYIKFDLLSEDVPRLIEQLRPNLLVHLAWETDPRSFWASPKNIEWLDASKELFESFRKWGGERIIVSGTCAEYDWNAKGPFSELSPECPQSVYGQSKLDLLNSLRIQPLPFLWARTFFQFGGQEASGRLIPSLIDALLGGRNFTIQKPNDIRDFIYVHDVVDIMTALIISGENGVFNVGSGLGITVSELANKVASILGRNYLLDFHNQREMPSIVHANMSKLEKTLGSITYTSLENAIIRTIRERSRQ
jgi:UDP-glucuronate decarboxylase